MSDKITNIFQGDSSKQITVKVYDEADAQITVLTNYTGWFALVTALGATPLISRAMTASGGAFVVTITPTEAAALAVGEYIGVAEIANAVLSPAYRQEIHFAVVVETQGYVAA